MIEVQAVSGRGAGVGHCMVDLAPDMGSVEASFSLWVVGQKMIEGMRVRDNPWGWRGVRE